jgi:tetratricopeptide (TPR) repeat protein
MPGIAYQRGRLLYDQKRYAMAADEFRKELSATPNSGVALGMLALSLMNLGKDEEALEAAKAAVAADPRNGFCHYVLSCVIIGRPTMWRRARSFRLFDVSIPRMKYIRRLLKAVAPAMEAIRLNPFNADFLALMSAIEFDLQHYRVALDWADRGLAANPRHIRSANLRAKALSALRRFAEARSTLDNALNLDPNNAATHATTGWMMLKQGKNKDAARHFTESLRVNPLDENAKTGLDAARQFVNKRSVRFAVIIGVISVQAIGLFIKSAPTPADPPSRIQEPQNMFDGAHRPQYAPPPIAPSISPSFAPSAAPPAGSSQAPSTPLLPPESFSLKPAFPPTATPTYPPMPMPGAGQFAMPPGPNIPPSFPPALQPDILLGPPREGPAH